MFVIVDVYMLVIWCDVDLFDVYCDYLLVVDYVFLKCNKLGCLKLEIVGIYWILCQDVVDQYDGFYIVGEFDIWVLVEVNLGKWFMELGCFCVLKFYWNKKIIELFWYGLWFYVLWYKIDVMVGCVFIEGIDFDVFVG